MFRWLPRTPTEPPRQPGWQAVARAHDQYEAEMIVDILRQHGITAHFRRSMGVDLPELTVGGARVVLVAAERAGDARDILDSLDVGDDPPALPNAGGAP